MYLVFASHNPNKINEIQHILPSTISIEGLSAIGCLVDIPETAATIEGNAMLKANFITEKYGHDCFADDSGLEVESLAGAPGVHSARYAGESKDDTANMDKLLLALSGSENRKARFKTVIALNLGGEQYLFTGIITGEITLNKRGTSGFGYDPIFQPDGYSKTFAELSLEEKSQISHRALAVQQLVAFLKTR